MMEDAVWRSKEQTGVRIIGAGAFLPSHVVTGEQITAAIPGWTAEKLEKNTGIVERRYLWPLDVDKGCAIRPKTGLAEHITASDMGEVALRRALDMAGVHASEVDILVVVTCTPDEPRFSHDALELQWRLGLRASAHCFVIDSGCGGSLYVLDLLTKMLAAGQGKVAAVVGTNLSSPFVDADVYTREGFLGGDGENVRPYLSAYVFGDGAGAVVLRMDSSPGLGIVASLAGNARGELVRAPGGGTQSPAYGARYNAVDHAFIVNGRLVMTTYLKTMRRCIRAVADGQLRDVQRFYLHQPNVRALGALTETLDLRPERVASNVAYVGNTSSAGMFMLLAADLNEGKVSIGSGSPVVFAAIGAGIHYAAQLAYL
jgi:3-oxoacyl-[acyl-carrier-protein] synthase III